jgi:Fe2+ or Zn2+ uptake regulation protein
MKNFSVDLLLEHCIKNKKSLTPTRLLIIKTLFNHTKPQSAYELQNEINNTKVNLNISTENFFIDSHYYDFLLLAIK